MSTDRSAWHAVSPQSALETFGVQPDKGLSEAQAAESLKINGPNELPKSKRDPAWKVLLSQFLDPLVLALLAAAVIATVVAFLEGDEDDDLIERYANAGAILAIVILNAIIGFIQER